MRSRPMVMTATCGAILLLGATEAWMHRGQLQVPGILARIERATAAKAEGDRAIPMVPKRIAAQGRIEPVSERLDLAIGAVGSLAGVFVAEGDTVTKGELLAVLVNGDQQARVTEAAAQVDLRRAELEKLLNGARPEERRKVAAESAGSEASFALAKAQFARQQPLVARGVASQGTLDQVISSLRVAEASSDAQKAALELINAPPRPEDIAMAKANLALAEGNLVEQRALLGKTQLRSPIDGVVLRRYMKTGETVSVQPLIPILQIGDMSRVQVRAQVDETDIGRVEIGQRVWITAPAFPNRRFAGAVSRIAQSMGPKTVRSDDPTEKTDTNILDVFVGLDQTNVRLPSGLRVNVFVETNQVAPDDGEHAAN